MAEEPCVHTGLATGKSPFTLLRFAATGEELAGKTVVGMAERRGSRGVSSAPSLTVVPLPAPDAEIPFPADVIAA